MYVEHICKYSIEKMNKEVYLGIRAFQKKIKLFLKPGRLTYMILALKESMKFFLAKSTAPVFFHWPCLASLRLSQYIS